MPDIWDRIDKKYPGKLQKRAKETLRLLLRMGPIQTLDKLNGLYNVEQLRDLSIKMKSQFESGDENGFFETTGIFQKQIELFTSMTVPSERPINVALTKAIKKTAQKLGQEHWASLSMREKDVPRET